MVAYKIYFKASVERDLRNIPQKELVTILQKIESLSTEPRPHGSEKLSGQDRYRIRQGDYRILYSIKDDLLVVWIVKVGHRKFVYR